MIGENGSAGSVIDALAAGFGALAVVVIAGWAGLFPRRTAPPRVLLALTAATSVIGMLAAGHLLFASSNVGPPVGGRVIAEVEDCLPRHWQTQPDPEVRLLYLASVARTLPPVGVFR